MVVVERGCDRSDIFCFSASVNVNPNKAALLLGRVVLVPAAPSCPAPPLFMLFDCDYERGAEKLQGRTLPCAMRGLHTLSTQYLGIATEYYRLPHIFVDTLGVKSKIHQVALLWVLNLLHKAPVSACDLHMAKVEQRRTEN